MPETLKATKPGHHLSPLELKTFKYSELCVVAHLKQYIKMTAPFKNTDRNQLLLSFVQPHKPISITTLSRGCVTVMKQSGITVNIFGSHSTRSASASKCKISGLSFKELAKSAGWSNETFAQFCDRPSQAGFSSYLFRWNLLFFICICIYCVIYTGNIYGVNYARNNNIPTEKNCGWLIISSLIFSNLHLYEKNGSYLGENVQIKLALMCEGEFELFLVSSPWVKVPTSHSENNFNVTRWEIIV